MTTPAKTSDVPAPTATAYEPVPVLAPIGWVVLLMTGILVILSTWYIYPNDADGMWAGYRTGMVATVALLMTFVLRTRVSPAPALGVLGLCGALLVLFALVYDDGQRVFVTELGGGILLLLGTLLFAAGRRS